MMKLKFKLKLTSIRGSHTGIGLINKFGRGDIYIVGEYDARLGRYDLYYENGLSLYKNSSEWYLYDNLVKCLSSGEFVKIR